MVRLCDKTHAISDGGVPTRALELASNLCGSTWPFPLPFIFELSNRYHTACIHSLTGHARYIPISRTRLQQELLRDISEKDVVLESSIESFEQGDSGVSVRCAADHLRSSLRGTSRSELPLETRSRALHLLDAMACTHARGRCYTPRIRRSLVRSRCVSLRASMSQRESVC